MGVVVALALGHGTAQADPSAAASNPQTMQAGGLIGSRVLDNEGLRIGWIDDLVVDVNNERVHCALITVPRMWGLWKNVLAYPITSFKRNAGGALIFSGSLLKPAGNDPLDGIAWPKWNHLHPRLIRASTLLGKPLVDRSGTQLGEIRDLSIDLKTGQILRTWVQFESTATSPERKASLPMGRFHYRARSGPALLIFDGNRPSSAMPQAQF